MINNLDGYTERPDIPPMIVGIGSTMRIGFVECDGCGAIVRREGPFLAGHRDRCADEIRDSNG